MDTAEPGWELCLHDAHDGTYISHVSPVDGGSSWSVGIDGDGQSSEVFSIADGPLAEPGAVDDTFRGNERMLVRWWGEFPMYAQKIDDWEYDEDAGTVTVKTVDISIETEHRLIAPVDYPDETTLDIVGKNASGAVHDVLYRMMQWGDGWHLPIDLPADGAGDFTKSYAFWRKLRISDILQEIREVFGVHIYFRAYRAGDGSVRFETIVAKRISVGSTRFHLQAAERPLSGVKYRKAFANQKTGILGVGFGSGQDQHTKSARRTEADTDGIIIRDTKETFDGLTGDDLQNATDEALDASKKPVELWTVRAFNASGTWSPADAAAGQEWTLESHDHAVFPDGDSHVHVTRASGDGGTEIAVEIESGVEVEDG